MTGTERSEYVLHAAECCMSPETLKRRRDALLREVACILPMEQGQINDREMQLRRYQPIALRLIWC